MEHLLLKAAVTPTTEKGVFEAVISSATVDREKDVVSPAGMVRALGRWTPTGKKIPLAWQHSTAADQQIGYIDPATARVIGQEVWAKGWIDQSTETGAHAWRLVKMGTLGFSFGYLTLQAARRKDGGRHIEDLDVFEITATPGPMNNDTRVVSWKSLPNKADQWERAQQVEREAEAEQLPELGPAPLEPDDEPKAVTAPDPPAPPDPEDQRHRAAHHQRQLDEARLATSTTGVPETFPIDPEPDPVPEAEVPPEPEGQRRRASRHERELDERRLTQASHGVPPAPPSAPEPEPVPEPEVKPPDSKGQRRRASRHVRDLDDRRLAQASLGLPAPPPPEPEPAPEPEPEPVVIPDAKTQRRRAWRLERQAEEERIGEVKATTGGGTGRMLESMRAQADEFTGAASNDDDLAIMQQIARLLDKLMGAEVAEDEEEAGEPAGGKSLRRRAHEAEVEHRASGLAPGETGYAVLRLTQEEMDGLAGGELKAVWSASYVGALPDSAFLYVEPGGRKDLDGRTTPRSLRRFSYRDADGAIDLPHLRNALARIPQAELSQDVKDQLAAKARRVLANQQASEDPLSKAVWSTNYINDLPDSAFLYIESGGEKDSAGKTTPRSLRHFPVRDASGATDDVHVRNALSRIPQSNLPQSVKDSCTAKAQQMLDSMKSVEGTARGRKARAVDPLRRMADALELEFASDGESLHKPPKQKSVQPPTPEVPLGELRRRAREELLIALSGVNEL